MWDAIWCCISPLKILIDSLRLLNTNKLLFSSILCFATLPLSFLTFTLAISTHTLASHIYHLEAVARAASTRVEATHVWHESRHDAVSLLRTRALFSLLCFPLSLAAAVSSIHAAVSAVQGKAVTVSSAVRNNWKRPAVTAIFVYAILLAFAPVARVLGSAFVSPWSRVLVRALGSGAEVYLMAVLSLGLVVSVAEERFGWDAIRVGSGLMQGRRFCGWFLSALLVLVSGLINGKVQFLMENQNSEIGVWDKTLLMCSYALVVLLSYVINAVFYCDSKRRLGIKEADAEADGDDHDCVSLSSSL
ncbi:uncharacterized protein LOC113852379 [Abrus precatorius]|uniref:Uncharacterized protein LOC113852379 n=1 Tax=Abrus precatorius TaxID=3816 RepID=A0A8B8K521_ABRPR|nr:uncharacterized protein LOC113852379 [Abrus precatorius]